MKRLLLAGFLSLIALPAFAACPATLQIKAADGTTANAKYSDDGSGNCQPDVVVNSSVLPTGAATSALQSTGNTALTTINTTLGSPFQAGASIGNTTFGVNAQTTGGASITSNIVPNNTTAVVVKASAGTLYGFYGYSISATTPAWLKIYNATSATCGSGTPVARLLIPYDSATSNNGSNVPIPATGIVFGTGITYCVTTGIADNDTSAPAASTYVVNLVWK